MNELVNPAGFSFYCIKARTRALIPKAQLAATMNQPDIRVLVGLPPPGTQDIHSSGAASI
jgi:hypothetical protein